VASGGPKAFDFYDTLVTRMVGTPADIFSIVGWRLHFSQFRQMRIAAEERARKAHGELVTFDTIYEYIPLSEDDRKRAYELELHLESCLVVPVRRVISLFNAGDIIVSDMYHAESLYRDILARFVPAPEVSRVYVSALEGGSKANGLLWKKVAAECPAHRMHFGDNFHADIIQARRNGFTAHHIVDAQLNHYEQALSRSGVDGSMIAGAAKAARVSMIGSETTKDEESIITVFASVIAPLAYAFSNWIIKSCLDQDIRRVYFLARDGYLPYRICKAVCAARIIPLECVYIYGSRHALHLPGFRDIDLASDWLLERTYDLSLDTIAKRAGIPVSSLQKAASPPLDADPYRKIGVDEWDQAKLALLNPSVIEAIGRSSQDAFGAAFQYYRSVGLTDSAPAGLVDIGWNGRMQQSLRSLLDKAGSGPSKLMGLYLCLSRSNLDTARDSYHGFLFRRTADDLVGPLYDDYRPVLEAAFSADHPTTVRFAMEGSTPRVVLGSGMSDLMLQRIRLQHEVVRIFTENAMKLEAAMGRNLEVPFQPLVSNLKRFLGMPRQQDGRAFCGFGIVDGQVENGEKDICKIIRLGRHSPLCPELGWWPQGTLAASGYQLLALLVYMANTLKCWARKMRSCLPR